MSSNLSTYPMDATPLNDGNRFRIPKSVRDELGLEGVIRVRLTDHDARTTMTMDDRGRARIPNHLVEKYDIGDDVDIEILVEGNDD